MKPDILRTVPGIQIHYADDRCCVSSSSLRVLLSFDGGTHWHRRFRLPSRSVDCVFLRLSLYSRLTRGGIHSVSPALGENVSEWVVVAQQRVYLVSFVGQQATELFRIKRGKRPLRRGICVVGRSVILGDYWGNPKREPVCIYEIHLDTGRVETLYQFGAGTVRHIHVVEKDPYSDFLWISTGDLDLECMIALLDPYTKELRTIGHSSQEWRTVSFAFRPEAVYWGTDNHLGGNQIWRFDRATGATQMVSEVIGPVYYNVCLDACIVFGTTMEKGEGQQDGFGRLYAVDFEGRVREIWKQKKDRWDARLFGYGSFEFAEGHLGGNRFWVTAKGFEGGERSILFRLGDS
jgi:hypothetical protein